MEANNFIAKLKADGSSKDVCDLNQVIEDYKSVLTNLGDKNRGAFSLNVLCILCRNLNKVPSWASKIDNRALLCLSVDCIRETRGLPRPESVKTLACIYHIHKYVSRLNATLPPEYVLKISYMPFESDKLLHEHCKTYWNILADRLIYLEQLKTGKQPIIKLLQKLTEDIAKIIQIYDTVQFCSQVLTFLIKKLHSLYNDYPAELNKLYGSIMASLSSKSDLKLFKSLTEKESLELYKIFSDCVYFIAENSSRTHFKDTVLQMVLRCCMSLLGHRPEIVHCFQTFYVNSFCCIINETNMTITESIMNTMILSCETTEKLYKNAMKATYPYINQFMKLYVEYLVTNSETNNWMNCFPENVQVCCLNLMLILMKKLNSCEQTSKCENCVIKNGLHDILRLTFLIKHFISISFDQKLDLTNVLPVYLKVVYEQQSIVQQLGTLGCTNYEKYYKKLQIDVHNTAILLNKSQHYVFSIDLFDLYLKNEIIHFKNDTELKSISRGFYNKSICELDNKLYENALYDAYMGLVFGWPDSSKTDKHMSLVMDLKAKILKAKSEEENQDELQLMSVLDACKKAIETNNYGNLKPFFCNLKFSDLLRHEFSMYVKLWPSLVPIAGVCCSLYELSMRDHQWLKGQEDVLPLLYEVMLETPTAVRIINSEYYFKIVNQILDSFEGKQALTTDERVLQASLLLLRADQDLADASLKHGWRTAEPSMDPDQTQTVRTLSQEFEATRRAIEAVELWTLIVKQLDKVTTPYLRKALQIAQVFVPLLIHLRRTGYGLQLAHACCLVAGHIGDGESYIRNAGTILYHADRQSEQLSGVIAAAARYWPHMLREGDSVETALIYVCDCAIFYTRVGAVGAAAALVRLAQAYCVRAYEKYTDINLDLAVGRLMEAQTKLCKDGGLSTLSAVNRTQKHYVSVPNNATKWTARTYRKLTLKCQMSQTGVEAALASRTLLAWRRARCTAGVALPSSAAARQAELYAAITNTHLADDAQIKIDNRLKHILGLQPSNDTQPYYSAIQAKTQPIFTPKQDIETMLDHMNLKKTQISPSIPCFTIAGFKTPEFLYHEKICDCYACDNPFCLIQACLTSGLEASIYYRSKENDIANNYFEGTLKSFDLVEEKLKNVQEKYSKKFEKYICDIVKNIWEIEFLKVKVEILIEAAFFELSKRSIKNADEYIVRIHEIIQGVQIDVYLGNKIMNLMTVSSQIRKLKKTKETDLEIEMDSLKISPDSELPKTPEAKPVKPPKITKIVVKDEEIMNTKRRVIKLNLDDADEKEVSVKKRASKRTQFKIPVPVTTKPVLENLTPKPKIVVTKPEETSIFDIATPKPKSVSKNEFFTPAETPEQFFTPMTSIKTYAKKSLRKNIVKNLENEFSTPNCKDNLKSSPKSRSRKIETGTLKTKDKRSLKRATSPGKLPKEEKKVVRSSRLRQPVRFSIDDDDK